MTLQGGDTTGTIHKQLGKKTGFTKKARNSSYCLCYISLTLVKRSKTLCPQLPRPTPPADPPSSGISSDEPNYPAQVSRAPSRFPDCFLLQGDYNSRFGTAVSSVNSSGTATAQTPMLLFTGRSACAMKTLQRSWNAPAMESQTALQPASQHWRRKG